LRQDCFTASPQTCQPKPRKMADTAATVNEITTHFFGDAMARDLGFSNTNCYDALDCILRAMDTRGALLGLDDALGQVADVSTPRAPVDLPFLKVNDVERQPKPYGGADWRYPDKEEAYIGVFYAC
jgi:hypothetical protein